MCEGVFTLLLLLTCCKYLLLIQLFVSLPLCCMCEGVFTLLLLLTCCKYLLLIQLFVSLQLCCMCEGVFTLLLLLTCCKYLLLIQLFVSLHLCCMCKGASTPLKKRRLTADAMSSGSSSTLLQDAAGASWSSTADDQFQSRQRLLASRNLFEVRPALYVTVSFLCLCQR